MKLKKAFGLFVSVFVALVMTFSVVACSTTPRPKCEHDWVAATCTEPEHCSKCNTKRGEALGHNGKRASCTQKEVCTRCGLEFGEPGTHHYETVETQNATCDEPGLTVKECTVCHDRVTDRVDKLSHNYKPTVEPGTCEIDEVTVYTCEHCKDTYSEVTKRHEGHDLDGVVWSDVSEEAENGYECTRIVTQKAKCKTCGEDVTRTYHKHVYMPRLNEKLSREATCKTQGELYYECICGNDDYAYTVTLPVNEAAHVWQETSEVEGATHICLVCGKTKNEVSIAGDAGEVSAAQLAAKTNVSIATSSATLVPDAALVQKMSGGVQVKTEPVDGVTVNDDVLAEAVATSPVYNFEMNTADGEKIDFDGGVMTVTVPYDLEPGEDPTSVTVWYIDDQGKMQNVEATYGNGYATFKAQHFSHYTVLRLTPEQRCQKLGHDYHETVYAETCTDDGFTTKSCRRCGHFERVEGKKRTGHSYTPSVVAPTCTEKGYTLYECDNGCGTSYISKYTDMIPHEYADNTVAPTCTTKGYTSHVCKNCGSSYRDGYTDTVAHTMSGGVCTVCGLKTGVDLNDTFYLNLLSSLVNYDGDLFYELKNGSFTYTQEDSYSGKMTVNGSSDVYRLNMSVDKDGNIVGGGEGSVRYTMTQGQSAQSGTQKVTVAYRDGKMYAGIVMSDTYDGMKSTNEMYVMQSQMPDDVDINSIVSPIFGKVKPVIAAILDVNAETPLNGNIARIVEFLFTKTETASGYSLTLNYENIKKAVEFANTHSVAQCFDEIFGEGKFAELKKFASELADTTLNALIEKLSSTLGNYNVNINEVYDIIDAVLKAAEVDMTVDQFIKQYGESTVAAIAEELTDGHMPAKEFKSAIDTVLRQYVPKFEDENLSCFECIYESIVGVGHDTDNDPYKGLFGFIKNQLDLLIEAANGKIAVTLNTDARGAFESFNVKIDGFEFGLAIPASFVGSNMSFSVKGTLEYTTSKNGTAVDANKVVNAVESNKTAFEKTVKANVGKTFETEDKETYTFYRYKDGTILFAPVFTRYQRNENFRVAEYNGEKCYAVDFTTYNAFVVDFDNESYEYQKSCTGWTRNSLNGKQVRNAKFTVYFDNTKILGTEVDWDSVFDDISGYGYYGRTVYFNAKSGAISLVEPHKNIVVERHESKDCEDPSYVKYRCTVCGEISYEYSYRGHYVDYTYTLKDASKGCAGGVLEHRVCRICNKDLGTEEISGVYTDGTHRTFDMEKVVKTECGENRVVVYGCVCGETVKHVEVYGVCEMGLVSREPCGENGCTHGYIEHTVDTYECAVQGCDFKYTVERTVKAENGCEYIYTDKYTVDGKTYTTSFTELRHHMTREQTPDGEYVIQTEKCTECGKVFSRHKMKVDEQGRTLYNFDMLDKTGYENVYDGCTCTRYSLNEDGTRGEVMEVMEGHAPVPEMTQENGLLVYTYKCSLCHKTISVEKYEEITVERNKYSRQVYSYSVGVGGYERVYDSGKCTYTEYRLDKDGKRAGEAYKGCEHLTHYSYEVSEEKFSCTLAHEVRHYGCRYCMELRYVSYTYYGHNFDYDENDNYVCLDCGMTADKRVDGPITLESMMESGKTVKKEILDKLGSSLNGNLVIGFNVSRPLTGVEIYAVDANGNETLVETVSPFALTHYKGRSGVLVISADKVKAMLAGGAQTVRISFVCNGKGLPVYIEDEYSGWGQYAPSSYVYNNIEFTAKELEAFA